MLGGALVVGVLVAHGHGVREVASERLQVREGDTGLTGVAGEGDVAEVVQVPLRMRAPEEAQDVQYDGEREHVAQDESQAARKANT